MQRQFYKPMPAKRVQGTYGPCYLPRIRDIDIGEDITGNQAFTDKESANKQAASWAKHYNTKAQQFA